jgi:hypothetical protein
MRAAAAQQSRSAHRRSTEAEDVYILEVNHRQPAAVYDSIAEPTGGGGLWGSIPEEASRLVFRGNLRQASDCVPVPNYVPLLRSDPGRKTEGRRGTGVLPANQLLQAKIKKIHPMMTETPWRGIARGAGAVGLAMAVGVLSAGCLACSTGIRDAILLAPPDLSSAAERAVGDGRDLALDIAAAFSQQWGDARTATCRRLEVRRAERGRVYRPIVLVETYVDGAYDGWYTNVALMPCGSGDGDTREMPSGCRLLDPLRWELVANIAQSVTHRSLVPFTKHSNPTLVAVSFHNGKQWQTCLALEPWVAMRRNSLSDDEQAQYQGVCLLLFAASLASGADPRVDEQLLRLRDAMIGTLEGMLLDKVRELPGGLNEAWQKLWPNEFKRTGGDESAP